MSAAELQVQKPKYVVEHINLNHVCKYGMRNFNHIDIYYVNSTVIMYLMIYPFKLTNYPYTTCLKTLVKSICQGRAQPGSPESRSRGLTVRLSSSSQ